MTLLIILGGLADSETFRLNGDTYRRIGLETAEGCPVEHVATGDKSVLSGESEVLVEAVSGSRRPRTPLRTWASAINNFRQNRKP